MSPPAAGLARLARTLEGLRRQRFDEPCGELRTAATGLLDGRPRSIVSALLEQEKREPGIRALFKQIRAECPIWPATTTRPAAKRR